MTTTTMTMMMMMMKYYIDFDILKVLVKGGKDVLACQYHHLDLDRGRVDIVD